MDEDRRIWMYRKGEARLFNSPDEVPKGEGWRETPVGDEPEPASKRRIKKDEYVKLDGEDDGDSA